MKIQILGTGCPKCRQLTENVRAAADQLGLEYEIEKVTDLARITKFGVMMTPALAVDGKVKSSGKLLDPAAIKPLLQG
jgi:small redox-active disulfide protein 2